MEGQHFRVFVACGTGTPFERLLAAVAPLAEEAGLELFVQRGPGTERFAQLPGTALVPRVEFARRLAWADVVVCHAGAGTLYEAYRAGHCPIVMPRLARFGEHVNDHQRELVKALAKRSLAVALEPGCELRTLLRSVLLAASRAPSTDVLPLVQAIEEELLRIVSPAGRGRIQRAWRLSRALFNRAVAHLRQDRSAGG